MIEDAEMKPRQPKRSLKPKKELTEDEKKERKMQRKSRIIKLQDMMNSVGDIFGDEEK